ncbi:MAG: hypothetical protein JXR96_11435 [Deltaproteobacteria bacterium]|nr:hypothetical protein [Deltaproteobacteria bacterium]
MNDWLSNGFLIEHASSPEEIAGLLSVIDRSLRDAATRGLSADGRFTFAFNAALQCAVAALAAEGYRPSRASHHYYAIESLRFTLCESEKRIRMLDASRKKRAISVYEISGSVSDAEVSEIRAIAGDLRSKLDTWLRQRHPDLMRGSR